MKITGLDSEQAKKQKPRYLIYSTAFILLHTFDTILLKKENGG